MKHKVGDLVTVCEEGCEYEGIVVQIDEEDPNYTFRVFVYDNDYADWYHETDLK